MKQTKHTPGPWEVTYMRYRKDGQHCKRVVVKADEYYIVTGISGHDHKESTLANARLIAAAPDLLEALKILGDWPRNSSTVDGKLSGNATVGLANVRRFARAAIAKADPSS